MQPVRTLEDQTDRLVRNTMLLGVVPGLLLGLLATIVVHPIVGVLVLVVVAGAWAALVWTRVGAGAARAVEQLGATHLAAGSEPRLENLLESVCVVGGIEEPQVRLVSDGTLNAAAVADRAGATFVVTRGLLDELGRVELEAVLANLAGRIKQGNARYVTTVLALPLPAGTRDSLLARGLGEQSSVRSDLTAVGLTRYPPGLISALAVMEQHGTAVAGAPSATAPLWLRIAVLQEL
jgi:Zn-dependent protease with chaperone function